MRFELKRIFSYLFILFLLIFFLESNKTSLELPVNLYLGLFLSVLGFLLIYLQIKAGKIFLILDTKAKREQYKDEKGINSMEGKRINANYKYWLLKNAEKNKINDIYKNFFSYNSQNYCLYCYFSTIPVLIVWVFSNMYMTQTEALVVSFSVIGCLVFLCIMLERREIGVLYKHLDSDIKQIIFEEVTGYTPLDNGKFTYKYKAWLILNE